MLLEIATIGTLALVHLVSASVPPRIAQELPYHRATRRGIVPLANITKTYDFIIAGGGLAGLALASRLSENSATTVLVLEAGDSGDTVRSSSIDPPAGAYYNSLVGTPYDWRYQTAPQSSAGNRIMPWPRGKVLGGSTALNAMYHIRPSENEVNFWHDMIASEDSDAAKAWSWGQFYESMKKSETFTPPTEQIQAQSGIKYVASSYGTSGPLQLAYSGFTFPIVGNWTASLESLGVPASPDNGGGRVLGGFISPSHINPKNWTRSYSRSAYIDSLPPRPNLSIVVNATVTRIVFAEGSTSSGLKATGVEFATSASADKRIVAVRNEVILSGGTVGSPQILMLSGVGPKDVLEAAGVPVKVDLPGVGQHLQDHMTLGIVWNASFENAGAMKASGSSTSSTPEFLSFINSAVAYINSTTLFGAGVSVLQRDILNSMTNYSATVPSASSEVVEGYKAIYDVLASKILPSEAGQIELLMSTITPGEIAVQAALQHPMSQGRLYINSSSAFVPPIIDPRYFSHFADATIMREGLKFVRRLGTSPQFRNYVGAEIWPGPSVNTDEQWDSWINQNAGTQYHPTASCAMLPKSQGGVVNAKLQVYGLANVRVVDASVFPITFAAHFAAPTYGIAEQAATMLRTLYPKKSWASRTSTLSGYTLVAICLTIVFLA